MIEVHLYGLLRRLVPDSRPDEDTILVVEAVDGETFQELINRLGLARTDIGDSFINGRLAREGDRVGTGDRVGLFPFNMRLIDGGMELKYSPYRR
jgi:hypothetical protein